jgi:hypothetical protein
MMRSREDEEPKREIVPTNARELLDAYKQKAGFETLYPEGDRRKRAIIPFVARFNGQIPDVYDYLAAGIQFEMTRIIRSKAERILKGNGSVEQFDWSRVSSHPLQHALEDLTISMGGGKGRKEGVEMAKSQPPLPQKSRWSWGRER